jgi:hypothetical protein
VFYGDSILVKDLAIPTKSVQLNSKDPLSSVEVACDKSFGTARVVGKGDSNRDWEIQITPSPTLPLGSFSYPVNIRVTDGANKPLPLVHLHVRGKVLPDVQAFPATLSLGQQPLGKKITAELSIKSARGESFRISSVARGLDVINVMPPLSNVADNRESYRFWITLVPSSAGSQESHVQLLIKKPGQPEEQLTVPIRYYACDDSQAARLRLAAKPEPRVFQKASSKSAPETNVTKDRQP